ncbi:MAG: hypothetical protein AB1427_12620 [Thermodesulfobacteriota bacterium]
MNPNNQLSPDEAELAPGLVRCSAVTRSGAPCKNLAIADGRCWMHGGRKKKSSSEDQYVSDTESLPAVAASLSVQQESVNPNGGGGAAAPATDRSPDAGASGTIEISETDIELISEGEAPESPTEAPAPATGKAAQPEILREDDVPLKGAPAPGEGGLEILWDDELPDAESPEEGMELGIEIDGAEPVGEEAEDRLQVLTDDELPDEEIEGTIEFDADSLGLQMDDEPAPEASAGDVESPDGPGESGSNVIPFKAESTAGAELEDLELEILPDDELPADETVPGLEYTADKGGPTGDADKDADFSKEPPGRMPAAADEDVLLEMLPDVDPARETDAVDIEITLDDDTVLTSETAAPGSDLETDSEPDDGWLGLNDINRFGVGDEHPKMNAAPEFAAPESEQTRQHAPQAPYLERPDAGASDAAPGYKTRTTIGKFEEIHLDIPRKGELKKPKGVKPPEIQTKSFWHRRVGIPAPIFWGTMCLLLALGGVSGLHYGLGVRIPYVSALLLPKVKDAGNLKIAVYGIESRFVQNTQNGMLLVITGWVRNDYDTPRGQIRVTGRLFTSAGFVKSQTVYCGDLIPDETLGDLPAEIIQKRLSERIDAAGPIETVAPRQPLPFMIVFSQLPDDLESLEKYTVEVTGSSPTG